MLFALLLATRLVVIDQDGDGPAESNQNAMLALLNARDVKVLGITVPTGNAQRDEEVQHTLRMLELTGHRDVPVVPGAVVPLVRTQEETALQAQLSGKPVWLGAWGGRQEAPEQGAVIVPGRGLVEGAPATKPLAEDAAHFIVRMLRAHPHEVTLIALGPLTDVALALRIDPAVAELAQGIAIMGGSLSPRSNDPEFATNPRFEFNFWFDPEAARIVLRAPWKHVEVTTVDVSVKTMFTQAMFEQIARSHSPAAQYIAKYSRERYYLWDELAACAFLEPSIITKRWRVYMDVDLSHGPSYGATLTWPEKLKPQAPVRAVEAQMDLDAAKFNQMFVELLSR